MPRFRDLQARLWAAAAAAFTALLLLWLVREDRTERDVEGAARQRQQHVERRAGRTGFELVNTNWNQDEVYLRPEDSRPYLDPEELRLLNEARERWQNLDVAVKRR